jgi:AraC-like DNA-binding protein
MKESIFDLAKLMSEFTPQEGINFSPVPGVVCMKVSQISEARKQRWHSRFAIVVQGCKEVVLEREVFRCKEGYFTATPLELPVISRFAEATLAKPFLGILIDFDPVMANEIAAQIEKGNSESFESPVRGFFSGKANDSMLETFIRLVKLFKNKEDAAVIGPLVVRELFYHLLKSRDGAAIRQFVRSGSKMHKIAQSIHMLQSHLHEEIDVVALANEANMSRSAFFKHFKDVTSMSPIQYQKRLRLLEARRLLLETDETAERSAFKVGYKSASQFSREYSRMFGVAPSKDKKKPAPKSGLTD